VVVLEGAYATRPYNSIGIYIYITRVEAPFAQIKAALSIRWQRTGHIGWRRTGRIGSDEVKYREATAVAIGVIVVFHAMVGSIAPQGMHRPVDGRYLLVAFVASEVVHLHKLQ
jgi:hypothetical protein